MGSTDDTAAAFARVRQQHRDALVRAVLATQWAVAIALVGSDEDEGFRSTGDWARGWDDGWCSAQDSVSSLPCPVDVIAGILGDSE